MKRGIRHKEEKSHNQPTNPERKREKKKKINQNQKERKGEGGDEV